jgi:hypothetical protein
LKHYAGSEDLKLLITALNNSLKKRVDLASRATADFLNNAVFSVGGPIKRLAACLGNTGERAGECVLQNILPDDWTQSIFPVSDTEATARPLVKGKYNHELHLAIGLLRMFDAEANSPVPGTPPQCDFRNSPYMEAGGVLNPYGPLFFSIAENILSKLSPILADMFCNAADPVQVAKAMNAKFTR